MDANNEEVSDEDGCMSRSMTIKAISAIMTERIWINCAASEIVFQPMYPDTGDTSFSRMMSLMDDTERVLLQQISP